MLWQIYGKASLCAGWSYLECRLQGSSIVVATPKDKQTGLVLQLFCQLLHLSI